MGEVNVIEACAIKLNPDWKPYWPFFQCMETNYDTAAAAALDCAKTSGLDYSTIATCAAGEEGQSVEASMARATPDHPGVPYILVNGQPLDDPSTLLKAVCDACDGAQPAGCSEPFLSANSSVSRKSVHVAFLLVLGPL